ncbi:DUF4105 domain-containing protein [Leptospira congkakensis]|uniref:DUF4105 domain-containing protein n=1 Tax=Leptospira congkakensis TaxID=2484932 RepID=A0A4Z1A240_9LEPT|nr:DUF4105 domain-containing protein [Leptospira congkakensis]TGL87578.1 DUF4105 domain-containing protein [Leptospira congkakensis]TGL89807.1 DUF4105 domain-containing protein [Leptospira congkakensis]TGL95728.1 DUF4105 domain-containing protein [Leptospira congkakensis]
MFPLYLLTFLFILFTTSLGAIEPPSSTSILELDFITSRKQGENLPKSPKAKQYLQELINEAKEKHLSEETHWYRLLRFKKTRWGYLESEVDNKRYFLSPDGKYNPEKELIATLHSFFTEEAIQEELLHPQCYFPERYHWLKEKLKFDQSRLPEVSCERFKVWKDSLNPDSLSVVFSSYYMQAPASMFGHTLIKLNNKINENAELLDYGVNYAANPVDMDPFSYAYRGLTGGYPGSFAIFPYYLKVNEYNDMESRDLWEYKLKLKPEERDRFMRHLWEMGRADFDYFFINENCSYHLMEILEVAMPELNISNKPGWIVAPGDTIKLYLAEDGLVISKKYRPSLYSKIKYKIYDMTDEERTTYFEMIRFEKAFLPEPKDNFRMSLVTDAVLDTYRYRYTSKQEIPKQHKEYYDKLLVFRSKQTDEYTSKEEVPLSTPPEASHPLSRVATSFGASSLGNFAEFQYRIAYHDLLNVSKGHAPNSELAFFDTTVRTYENKKPELTSMSAVKVTSINPYNSISKDITYMLDTGIQTAVYRNNDETLRKQVGNFDFRFGYSFSNEFGKTPMSLGVLSVLAGVKAQNGRMFENNVRYGVNVSLLYQKEWGNWKVFTGATAQNYQLSQNFNTYYATFKIRYAFSNTHELRVEVNGERFYEEALVSYHYLF